MEDFSSLISKRRSTRKFTDQLLTPEQVETLLKAALKAPTSKSAFSWEFIVIEDKQMLKSLAGCKKHGAAFIEGCALAIVVLGNGAKSNVWIEDASVASIYMQLQAEDLGLGSCWCQIRNRYAPDETESEQYIRQLLGISYQLNILSIIAFGHKGQERKPFNEENLLWEKVHIGAYKTLE